MNYTEEQQAVIDMKLGPGQLVKVQAGAGTGKTQAFIGYAAARLSIPILYLTFNKAAAESGSKRFSPNATCQTINSVAFRAIGRNFCQGEFKIANDTSFISISKELHVNYPQAALINNTLVNYLNSADDEIGIAHAALHPDDVLAAAKAPKEMRESMMEDLKEIGLKMVENAKIIWEKITGQAKYFNMTHSGYLKLYQLSKPRINTKVILLDEGQDTNPVSLDLVLRQAEYGTRVIICGDNYQSIYQWRGAIDALKRVDCPVLFLTQSFRFGPIIAEVANILLGHYFSPDFQLQGMATIEDKLVLEFEPEEPRTVICRTNCWAFARLVKCLTDGVSFHLVGNVVEFVDKILDVWWLKTGRMDSIKSKKIKALRDYNMAIEMGELDQELKGRCTIVEKYLTRIPQLCLDIKMQNSQPEDAHTTVITGHKCKGLEYNNVQLETDFDNLFKDDGSEYPLLPPVIPEGKTPDDFLDPAEINLAYVSVTRAKRKLLLNNHIARLVKQYRPDLMPVLPPPREVQRKSVLSDENSNGDFERF